MLLTRSSNQASSAASYSWTAGLAPGTPAVSGAGGGVGLVSLRSVVGFGTILMESSFGMRVRRRGGHHGVSLFICVLAVGPALGFRRGPGVFSFSLPRPVSSLLPPGGQGPVLGSRRASLPAPVPGAP